MKSIFLQHTRALLLRTFFWQMPYYEIGNEIKKGTWNEYSNEYNNEGVYNIQILFNEHYTWTIRVSISRLFTKRSQPCSAITVYTFIHFFGDLPEICYYESVDWLPVESDLNSDHPRRAVASCIPAQDSARNFEADCRPALRSSLCRKSSATIARLPSAPCSPAGRSGSSDCSAPVLVVVQACKVPPHLEHMVCSQLFPATCSRIIDELRGAWNAMVPVIYKS